LIAECEHLVARSCQSDATKAEECRLYVICTKMKTQSANRNAVFMQRFC
jgi:hypothetical protein